MLRPATAATAALAMLASCAPDTEAPVRVRALVLTSAGQYEPQEVELKTVTDIVRLEGSVARFVGGARIVADSNDPELTNANTPEALENALMKDRGSAVTASYIEKDGVLWPADFHTWNLVTSYYALERANEYFRTVGGLVDADFGGATTVYYFPDFILADTSKDPLRDNALYFPPVKSFMVLPFDELQLAPLAINANVLAHEYSHRVFNQKVYGGESLPTPIATWQGIGFNTLKSLDEGLADYHAYGSSCTAPAGCNTNVLTTSFEDAGVAGRDFSKPLCMSQALRNQMYTTTFNGAEYQVGTVLASALYAAGQTTGQHKVIQKAVLAAYSDNISPGIAQLVREALATGNEENFPLELPLGAIARHIPDTNVQRVVCNQFVEQLGINRDLLVAAGCRQDTILRPSNCPKLD